VAAVGATGTRHAGGDDMKKLLFALLAALAVTASAQPSADEALERGRQLTQAFYAGELAPIAQDFSAEMIRAVGDESALRSVREQLLAQLGDELQVLDERVDLVQGLRVYCRVARFERDGGPVLVKWSFGEGTEIAGMLFRSLGTTETAPSSYLEHQPRAALRLPFEGEWTVFWGGRTVEENYHAAYVDQRFAMDLVIVRDGSTHTGDGGKNSDYHCFGQPILAPGDAVVVAALDGVPDNAPGVFDDEGPLGNHVVIDHGTGEYSFLAHLRQGSVRVEPGQAVAAGEVVGECGNSG